MKNPVKVNLLSKSFMIVLVLFVSSCGRIDSSSSFTSETIFSIGERIKTDMPSRFEEIDWSQTNIMIIQGYQLESRPIFIGEIANKTVFPVYLGYSQLSTWTIPKLSSDGNYLAFQSAGNVYIASMGYIASHNYKIWPASYVGSFEEDYICSLEWSFDTDKLASICLIPDGLKISLYDLEKSRNEEIYEYSESGISDVEGASWSSDETMIAFSVRYGYDESTGQRSQSDIFIYHLDTNELVRLNNSPSSSERNPKWYSESEILTFAVTDEGEVENEDSRLAFSTNDGVCTKFPLEKTGFASPVWSPDGSKLAYIENWENIKVINTSQFFPTDFPSPRSLCN